MVDGFLETKEQGIGDREEEDRVAWVYVHNDRQRYDHNHVENRIQNDILG